MLREEKESLQKSLTGIEHLCDMLSGVTDAKTQIEVLVKCQEVAIAVGENLEQCQRAYDIEAVKNLNLISMVEDFCEAVYQCTQESVNENKYTKLKLKIRQLSSGLELIPKTYRVVFLPYKAAMWDSLESIWRAFAADAYCETTVVPIPYFAANRQTDEWDVYYDGNLYPPDVPVVYFQDYLLGDKKPDVIFMHYPFDNINNVTSMHPAYFSEELKKKGDKLAYVPYYVNAGFISDDYIDLPLLHRADYLFFQSERAKKSCEGQPYYDRIAPLGSPKFDKVIRLMKNKPDVPKDWNIDLSGKKSLMLNTTLTDFLKNGEALINKLYFFFNTVKDRDELVIIWRPHPLLEGTVKAMRPQFVQKYQDLVQYFCENSIGVFDTTGDVSTAVVLSDGYIGSSYSSMVDLFEVCGKPVYLFDSQKIYDAKEQRNRTRAKAEDVFVKKQELDYFACYESVEYMFEDFVDDMINGRLEQVKQNQLTAEADIAANLDGTAGEKIHEYIMNDLNGKGGHQWQQ